MNRANPVLLAGFLVASLLILAAMTLVKGGLFLGKHEGDVLHFLNLIFRTASGERPHIDFSTPIGVLAYAPAAVFSWLGAGIGHAMIYGQLMLAAVLLPAFWWVLWSRLWGVPAYFLGLYMIALVVALTPGAEGALSMSMSYNRWAWAIAYVAVLLAFLPERDKRLHERTDGLLIGAAFALLVMLKLTYAVALFLPVVAALVTRQATKTILWAVIGGAAVLAAATLYFGIDHWTGYFGDLVGVAQSDIRKQPGEELLVLLGAPDYLPTNLTLLLGVILLRQGLEARAGLLMLLFAPAFVYITYQNWGNDPQWLMLFFFLLMAHLPQPNLRNIAGWNLRTAVVGVSSAALVLAAPSFFSLAYSPYRHLMVDPSENAPLLERAGHNADIYYETVRLARVDGQIALDGEGTGLEIYRTAAKRDEDVITFQGEELPYCELLGGVSAWYDGISRDLQAAGFASGAKIYEADLLESLWLYGPFGRLNGASPWYYGGAPGFTDAEFVLVPACPLHRPATKLKLEAIADTGETLTVVRKVPLYTLYKRP